MTTTPTTISQLPAQSGALSGSERLVVDLDGATVAASAISVGGAYRVLTVGTTDWTTIGAASSTIGVTFVATAAGTGTGTAVALLTRQVSAQQVADLASTGPVDLSWNPATRTISSSAGADAQLTLATPSLDGLMASADAAKIAAIVINGVTGQALRLGSDGVWRGHAFTAADVGAIAAYVFDQTTPATTWTINHNLGYRPSVELLNSGSQEIDGEVAHPSVNQTIVTLNPATAGQARLT